MITAKVRCDNKVEQTEGHVVLGFHANYRDDAGNLINQEWAYATPHLSVNMTVTAEVGSHFEQGATYTLSFSQDGPTTPKPAVRNG